MAKKSAMLLFLFALILSSGCSHDPNVRKQKYLQSGNHYFQQGKYQEAAIQFQNAIQIDRAFVEAHSQLAKTYMQEKLWQQAYRELSTVAELEPKNWQAQLEVANFLFAAKQFRDSRDRAASILTEDPNNVSALLVVATSDGQLGNMNAALQEAQDAVQMAPATPSPYLTLGLLQETAGQIPAAEQNLQKAVSINPKFLPARLGLASFYQRQSNWAASEAQYRSAIELEPRNLLPRSALFSLYAAWGKKDLAEQVLADTKAALPDDPAAYLLLGDFYFASGDLTKASAEFYSLYQHHPNNLDVKKRYILVLMRTNNLDQALKLDGEILKHSPQDAEALLYKGEILATQQKNGEALPVLEAAVQASPEDPVAHWQLGLVYYKSGNSAQAEGEWRAAVRLRPSLVEAQENLAKLALQKADWPLLQSTTTEWIKYAPGASQAYLYRGMASLKKGNAAAETDLRKAIELDSRSAAAYVLLGDLRLAQKRFSEAENLYEKALTINVGAPDALHGLATVFMLQNQPQAALRRIEAQAAKVPAASEVQFLLAEMLLANHKTDEALQAAQKAVNLDNNNISASLLLAKLQSAAGRLDDAASTLERSLHDNPKDVRPYVELGAFEERRGNWQKAQTLYVAALKIQPQQPTAANNLSYLILEHGGDLGYAVALARTAWTGMPDSANVADTLGWAYYKSGAYDSALRMMQEAAKKNPQNPTYQYHLGLVYQKSNQVELARASFKHALKMDPKSQRADEIRQALASLDASQ